jgi:hypothetical protein
MASAARVAALASQITSGNVARLALGQSLTDLGGAYTKVKDYNPTVAGVSVADSVVGLDPLAVPAYLAAGSSGSASQVAGQTTEYLDGIRTRAESDFAALPATDDPVPDATARQVAFDIGSIETACGVTNSTLNQSALQDYADSVTDAIRDAVPTVAKGLLGVVPWWVYVGAALVVLALLWSRR